MQQLEAAFTPIPLKAWNSGRWEKRKKSEQILYYESVKKSDRFLWIIGVERKAKRGILDVSNRQLSAGQ